MGIAKEALKRGFLW